MPLTKSKSDKAFKQNIKAEIAAGKLQKQAVAIAYSVKRKAQKKAGGGSLDPYDYDSDADYYDAVHRARYPKQRYHDDFGPEDARLLRERQKQFYAAPILKKPKPAAKTEPVKKARGGKVCW
jgi:hypothetical protein